MTLYPDTDNGYKRARPQIIYHYTFILQTWCFTTRVEMCKICEPERRVGRYTVPPVTTKGKQQQI